MNTASSTSKRLTCFCYWGGERRITDNGTFTYIGGVVEPSLLHENMAFEELVNLVCGCLQISTNDKVLHYNTTKDKAKYCRLKDQYGVVMLFHLNEDEVDMFVEEPTCINVDPIFLSSGASNLVENIPSPTDGTGPIMQHIQVSGSLNNDMGLLPLTSARSNELLSSEGQFFDSPIQFKLAVSLYAAINKFTVKFLDNSRSYYRIVCAVDGCSWKLTARCEGNSDIVRVIRLRTDHTHTAQDLCSYKAKVRTAELGSLFKDKIQAKPGYLPRDICREYEGAFATRLSYMQGWRAKEYAVASIQGPPSKTYTLIPWMCERIKQAIPNSHAMWTATEDGKFKQLFVAYGCCVKGFLTGCRPLLFIDACFLTGPYRGNLLSACAHDADDGLYPVAYAVVSSENDEDWGWFMQRIQEILCGRHVVFITDRNPSLLKAIKDVFGSECNAWCLRHLKENFSKYASSKMMKKGKKDVALKLVDNIAYARTEDMFQLYLTKLYGIHQDLGKWVEDNGPRHWANAFFPFRRWDKMYTNLAECFNAWILPERNLDIFQFIKGHLDRTTEMLLRKQKEVQIWKLPVGRSIENKIKSRQDDSKGFTNRQTSPSEFLVFDCERKRFAVTLSPPHCSCLEWQMSGIPCAHACEAIHGAGLSVYEGVDPVLRKETQMVIYETLMAPVALHDMPVLTEAEPAISVAESEGTTSTPSTLHVGLLPPATKRPAGRPRKKRIESQTQNKKTIFCGRCREPGHNRSTCTAPLPG